MLSNYARKLRLVSLLFLGCSMLGASADLKRPEESTIKDKKDKKEDKDAPVMERAPVPQAVKLTVNRGETVEITLSALTASNKDVQFILRNAPTAGKLLETEPVRKSKTTSVIHYQSDPASKLMRDEIKFAARVAGGSVSPAETVSITLQEIKAELILPERVEGGQIRCGQSTTVIVPIRNTGNGNYSQAVQLPAGWTLAQGDRVEVPAGKTVDVKLNFTPTTLGYTQGALLLGAGERSQTTLTGTGLLPVEVPGQAELIWDPATAHRIANVALRNTTDAAVMVKLTGDVKNLDFPKEISLAPRSTGSVALVLRGEPSRVVFQEHLEVTVLGLTQPLTLNAARAPALITLTGINPEGVVDFGNVDAAKLATITKSLTLVNRGGTPVSVYGAAPNSFALDGFTEGMTVQPGMEIPILVHFKPTAVGTLKNTAQLKWDKQTINFTIAANIIPDGNAKPMIPDAPVNLSGDPTDDLDPLNAADSKTLDREMNINRAGLLPADIVIDPKIPMIEEHRDVKDPGVYLKAATQESLTLAWKALPDPTYEYTVFYRVIRAINGYPRVIWVPYPKVVIAKSGDEVTALLKGIGPGWANELRVAAKSQAGFYGQLSVPKPYGIAAAEPPDYTAVLLYIAGAITVIIIIYLRYNARKNAFVPRRYVPRIEGETEV